MESKLNGLETEKQPRYVNINFKLSEKEKDALVAFANEQGIDSLHIAARTAAMFHVKQKVEERAPKDVGFSDLAQGA